MASLTPTPKQQFTDSSGVPLVGGLLYTYTAGTSTPVTTYQDQAGSVPNANPIVLDSRGECDLWLVSGSYKFVLKTSGGTTIWTVDNIDTSIAISSGTINGATIGLTTPAAAKFTDLTATGNTLLGDAQTNTLNVGNGDIIKDASGNTGIGTGATSLTHKLRVMGGSTTNYGGGEVSTCTAYGTDALKVNASGAQSVAVGMNALKANTSGTKNTVAGYDAMVANTTGANNAAFGYSALKANTTGDANIAIGYDAMVANTTGSTNIAIGNESLAANTTGANNIAIGNSASIANTGGTDTIAIGTNALTNNTTGTYNIGIGYSAGYGASSFTGSYNVGIGYSALYAATSGDSNTAIGRDALNSLNTGSNNTTAGRNAGERVTSGSNNTLIGYNAGADNSLSSITTSSNNVVLGDYNVTNAIIKVAWTVISDARDKTAFATIPHGINFVSQLKPISFRFKTSREDDTPSGPVRYGFLAQDVLELEGEHPVIINASEPDNLKYNESSLIPVLVKAIQELTARIAVLEGK